MNIQDEVLKYKNDVISSLQESIQIKSVEEEAKPGMPFGEGPAKALEHFLGVAKNLGFKTENFDNYVGHIDFGQGEETLGIVGHVDVVPEGTGWDYPPFSGKIVDNKMYGRGTLDDKGPLMICLYAMKALKDMNIPLKKKVRMIVGANEETNWGCMKHYFGKLNMPQPTLAFTPDSEFPVTFAEKGIFRGLIKIKTDCKDLDILGGKVLNAVPEKAVLTLPISTKEIIDKNIPVFNEGKEYKLSSEVIDNKVVVTSIGKAAHAAHPHLGYNSLTALMLFIHSLNLDITGLNTMAKFFAENIKMEFNGKSAGLFYEDEPSGEISMCYGKAFIQDGYMNISLDTRYPVTADGEEIKNKVLALLQKYGMDFSILKEEKPLYVRKDDPLVQTLTEVYSRVTGDANCAPLASGGGTYAKAVKNCVAFGALLKGTPDTMHQKNECIDLDTVDTLLKIYVEAIYKLAK